MHNAAIFGIYTLARFYMEAVNIVVGGMACGSTPIMPYVGGRNDGTYFTRMCKLYLQAALLRCGFDTVDIDKSIDEPQDVVLTANRHTADAAVIVSYGAFGSRKSFNDVSGMVVRYAVGRFYGKSRTMCEDVCAKLGGVGKCTTSSDGIFGAAGCPAATIDAGYLTQFDEARLVYDPDRAISIAEHATMGLCEYFGMPYVRRDDISAYPAVASVSIGKRGRHVKLLQALLAVNGYGIAVDGVFGKATDTAVKEFDINNGISDNGDGKLWRRLLLLDETPLSVGSKHAKTLYVQRKLRAKLYSAPVHGTLDGDTLAALNEFLTDAENDGSANADGIGIDAIELLSPIGGGKPRLF